MPKLMLLPRSTGRRGTGGVGLVGSAGWAFVGAACAIVGDVAGVAVWVVVVVGTCACGRTTRSFLGGFCGSAPQPCGSTRPSGPAL